MHTSIGRLGTVKCTAELVNSFKVKVLGLKVKRLNSHCKICQTVKHPNCSYATDVNSHLISRPGEVCAVDLFGGLTVRRAGVRCNVFYLEVFSSFIKLYPLRSANTKRCLNKISVHHITRVRHPNGIFSNNEPQFTSPMWPNKFKEPATETQFARIGHPQSKASEGRMKETGKLCKIYCHQPHRKWPKSKIEECLNGTVANSTGYIRMELIYDKPWRQMFYKFVKKEAVQMKQEED